MNGCHDMRALIARLAAGDLADDEADRAAAHLDACASCSAFLEALDAPADPDLAEAEAAAASPAVSSIEWDRVGRAIEAAVAPPASQGPRRAGRRSYALAAAFLLMLGAGVAQRGLAPAPTATRADGIDVATSNAPAPEGTVARAAPAPLAAPAGSALVASTGAPAAPAPGAAVALERTASDAPATSSAVAVAASSAPERPLDPAMRAAARGLLGKIRLASTETLHTDEDEEGGEGAE